MYRFLLRPKWVVGQVLVVVVAVTFVSLGFWQLRRLDERRDRNAVIAARADATVRPVDEVVGPDVALDGVDELVYRRVSATGTYDTDGEVLVRSRSLEGRPGYHVVTPLRTGAGAALMVNRGFLPLSPEDLPGARRDARPPRGPVTVTGLLFATQERGGFGPREPARGRLSQVSRIDLARLGAQYDRDLYPVYLQLDRQRPAQPGGLPVVLPPPERGEGPHLSYAVQWFLLATVAAVGWPLLVRRAAREQAGEEGQAVPARPPEPDRATPTGTDVAARR